MPIDFPSSPTTNQTYTYNNKIWVFNGSAWVGGTIVSLLPAGSMQMYAGAVTQSATSGTVTTTAPSGWLLANGNIVSRTTYSALFTAIGTTYGAGDGSTTFALPDMRSRIPVGVGTGSGLTARTLGGTVGTENETLSASQIPAHSHPNTVGSAAGGSNSTTNGMSANTVHSHGNLYAEGVALSRGFYGFSATGGGYSGNLIIKGNDAGAGAFASTGNSASLDHTHNLFITNANNTGGGGSHNNMQPSIGINYIIKT